MRTAALLTSAAALALLAPLRSAAQAPTALRPAATDASVKPTGPAIDDIQKRWAMRAAVVAREDYSAAKVQFDALNQLRLDLGIAALPPYTMALLREARQAIDRGQAGLAIELCNQADKLTPGHPEVRFTLARAYFAQEALGIGRIFGALFKGIGEFFDNPRYRDAYAANLLIVLALALLCAVLVFLVLQLGRYFGLLHHNVSDLLGVGKIPSGIILVTVLFLPIIFGLGPLGIILLWATLFWAYQRKSERAVTLGALAFTASAPLLVALIAPLFALQTPVGSDLLELATGHPSAEVQARSETRLRRDPDDFELLFLLARLEKSRGNNDLAEGYYKRAFGLGDRHAPLLNNYGNFLLATGRAGQAIQMYERATQEDPKFATAYYNLSQAYRQVAAKAGADSLQKHTAALESAERLDPQAVKEYRALESPNRNRQVIDVPLPEPALRQRALKDLGDMDVLRTQLWERIADWLPFRAAPWVPIGLIVVLAATWPLWRRLRPSFPCARCGSTVCSRCYPELSAGELCVQCHHIYLRGVSLDPKLRLEKEARIHRHHSRRRRLRVVLSAVLMGAGQVLAGRPGRGIALLCLFFFLVLSLLFWNGVVRYPAGSEAGPSVGKMVILGFIFLPAYLIGLAGVLKR